MDSRRIDPAVQAPSGADARVADIMARLPGSGRQRLVLRSVRRMRQAKGQRKAT